MWCFRIQGIAASRLLLRSSFRQQRGATAWFGSKFSRSSLQILFFLECYVLLRWTTILPVPSSQDLFGTPLHSENLQICLRAPQSELRHQNPDVTTRKQLCRHHSDGQHLHKPPWPRDAIGTNVAVTEPWPKDKSPMHGRHCRLGLQAWTPKADQIGGFASLPHHVGDRAPATLFRRSATIPIPVVLPNHLTLLSTHQGHRTGVPPLYRRRSGGRRGREPATWPPAEQGEPAASSSPLFHCSRAGKGESSVWEVRHVEIVGGHGNRLDVQIGFKPVLRGFHVLLLYLT